MEKRKWSDNDKVEKSDAQESNSEESIGFPDDVDFRKLLGCGG